MTTRNISPPLPSRDSELTISSSNPLPLPGIPGTGVNTPTSRYPALPAGCHYGRLPPGYSLPNSEASTDSPGSSDKQGLPVIWVDFPASSKDNPFFFPAWRKRAITGVAIFFTGMTALNAGAYSIGQHSLSRDLGLNNAQVVSGLAVYAWGFGIAPLALAPLSEEFGRKWTCIIAVFLYWQTHLFTSLGKNLATILVGRFIQGAAGSVGSTLVGGTISDIYIPSERGLPMAAFGAVAIASTGLGGVIFGFVEANAKLQWRWIQWIQYIIMGAYFPVICIIMRETRATVILRRRAEQYRKTLTGFPARFTARSEIEKVKFSVALQQSLLRPISFLFVEPIVTFFSLWVGLCWGVFYIQLAGLPYLYQNIFNFKIQHVGLIYLTMVLGAGIGFGMNFVNESLYQKNKGRKGVEARLYTPMFAGVAFAIGCLMFSFTSVPGVHWIGPCFGATIIAANLLTIYICNFTYLSECYGSYASSAIAAQSFTRNTFAGGFVFFTKPMFDTMTVRWGCFLFFGISAILAVVPFVAFFYGPIIRSHSKYSKQLMAEETRRIEAEKHGEEDPGDGAYEMEEGREGERLDERVAEDREKLQRGDAEPGAVGERTLST